MKRSPGYMLFMLVLILLCLAGVALLVWGAVHQGAAPRLEIRPVPPLVHHG